MEAEVERGSSPVGGRRYLLCANPRSGRGRGGEWLARAEADLRARGAEVVRFESRAAGELEAYARALPADPDRRDVLVSIGGDGTLNELISGLGVGTERLLAVLPVGTGNVVARELGVPLRYRGAFDVLLRGRERVVDVGVVGDHAFVFLVSAGFDAQVVAEAHSRRQGGMRRIDYLPAIWRCRHRPEPRFHVIADGEDLGGAAWAAFFNVRRYAGGFVVCPNARIDDGSGRLLLLRDPITPRLGRVLRAAARGRLGKLPDALERSASEVSFLAAPAVQRDGDPHPSGDVHLRVRPAALHVLAPR